MEETPGRRERSELRTPAEMAASTPGTVGWEDDDTPTKRNAWDLPTPGSRREQLDQQLRQSSHSRRDRQVTFFLLTLGRGSVQFLLCINTCMALIYF